MSERLDAINSNHWNVMLVTSQQLGVAFNVDLLKRIFVPALSCVNSMLGFIAKVTTRTAVDDDVSFS